MRSSAPAPTSATPSTSPATARRSPARRAAKNPPMPPEVPLRVEPFRARVREAGAAHWRDLPWRRTRDPYLVWISEVMLQQTQVPRVLARWDEWVARFPTVGALAAADDAEVLAAWQGMGYNRRALALHRAAVAVVDRHGGAFPREERALLDLPGVGPSTAAGIRAFAFDEAGVYLETNVRAVFIHELFPSAPVVPDAALAPLVAQACPASGQDVRGWYYALLDYGAFLKKAVPNPTRRAKAYVRQSRFEGSHRQKRALALRVVLAAPAGEGVTLDDVAGAVNREEERAGRPALGRADVAALLDELAGEGFCWQLGETWRAGGRPRDAAVTAGKQ